ncbi:MAG: SLC13 family permease [Synergistales bacterium]|nr:SLC13 family permease [Synergistales bacterium]
MTREIFLVFTVLGITVLLLISEKLRVDVIAILVMLALPWLGLVTPAEAFTGFSSNAVMSIIAVMILGAGMDRTGIMNRVAKKITSLAGEGERRLLSVISAMVGLMSAFMQNVGSVALFLPAVMKICRQKDLSPSRLLMPLGFSAILGGTLTMVGSGPLIILNDLLRSGGERTFGLFSVTPVGLALLGAGILYFLLLGRFVLPAEKADGSMMSPQMEMIRTWDLPHEVHLCRVPFGSALSGKSREDISLWTQYSLHLLYLKVGRDITYAPWRHTVFAEGNELALLGDFDKVKNFAEDQGLVITGEREELTDSPLYGFAEILILPRSSVDGKTLREIALRKNWGVEPLELITSNGEIHGYFPDRPLKTGDVIIVQGLWSNILRMVRTGDLVSLTPLERPSRPDRLVPAALCFFGALALALAGFRLSLALLTGALGMILSGVLNIDEAYESIDWRTVFLLAGLIPLGIAMEKTGAAEYVASLIIGHLSGGKVVLVLMAVGILATLFSLFMSNVAATVLLVPLVLIMGRNMGIDPRGMALLVAVCASNSFILPTHQVNAMLMSTGGYRNADYLRAGGIMSIVFLLIAVFMVYVIFI